MIGTNVPVSVAQNICTERTPGYSTRIPHRLLDESSDQYHKCNDTINIPETIHSPEARLLLGNGRGSKYWLRRHSSLLPHGALQLLFRGPCGCYNLWSLRHGDDGELGSEDMVGGWSSMGSLRQIWRGWDAAWRILDRLAGGGIERSRSTSPKLDSLLAWPKKISLIKVYCYSFSDHDYGPMLVYIGLFSYIMLDSLYSCSVGDFEDITWVSSTPAGLRSCFWAASPCAVACLLRVWRRRRVSPLETIF